MIPQYKIENIIYKSNNSIVYTGISLKDKKPVIIKTPSNEYPTAHELAKLKNEYEILKKIKATGIVKVYELVEYKNNLALITEDIRGKSLREIINSNQKLKINELLELFIKITKALGNVHAHNIIHKDINPSNIVFNIESDVVKIIDFGASSEFLTESENTILSEDFQGTLIYLAPEQTGRLNKSVDFRSDFYSLGITFYELLTGKPPFYSNDIMELIHSHIAKEPKPPNKIVNNIPKAVSDIVLKLLSKNMDKRYLSTFGILSDLKYCVENINKKTEIKDFKIGFKDVPDKFFNSDKLYGRENELSSLKNLFTKSSKGSKQIAFINGKAGIGKSSLIKDVETLIFENSGFVLTACFSENEMKRPYSAFIKPFSLLIKQILAMEEQVISDWKKKLKHVFGNDIKLIIDIVPEIELLIDNDNLSEISSASSVQNHFNIVFTKFFKLFSQNTHPLLLFLDDFHWADSSSLDFLNFFIKDPDLKHILIVISYRQDKICKNEKCLATLKLIENQDELINRISLEPLKKSDINQMFSELVKCKKEKSKNLCKIIFNKTRGNPFFIKQFLNTIYEKKYLVFDNESGYWNWDESKADSISITENVIDLITDKINSFSKKTQDVLFSAACIGVRFELNLLALVLNKSLSTVIKDLKPALKQRVIAPLNNSYMFAEGLEKDERIVFEFVHNRFQQVAYSGLNKQQLEKMHFRIGSMLLQSYTVDELENNLFDITTHHNIGFKSIIDDNEKIKAAELNLKACIKAKVSAAFDSAFIYVAKGINFAESSGWKSNYKLTLALYTNASEISYLCGNVNQGDEFFNTVLKNSKSALDKVKVYKAKIYDRVAREELDEAINTGFEILNQLNVKISQNPNDLEVILGLLKTKTVLKGKKLNEILKLPRMKDPEIIEVLNVLTSIGSAAYSVRPKLLPVLVFKTIQLCLLHGNHLGISYAFAGYSIILSGALGDIDSAYKISKFALKLAYEINDLENIYKAEFIWHDLTRHLKEPIRNNIDDLILLDKKFASIGQFEFAARMINSVVYHNFLIGKELNALDKQMVKYKKKAEHYEQKMILGWMQSYHNTVLELLEPNSNNLKLLNLHPKNDKVLNIVFNKKDGLSVIMHLITRTILYVIFRDFDKSLYCILQMEKYKDSIIGSTIGFHCVFYNALIRILTLNSYSGYEKFTIKKKINSFRRKLKKWAAHSPGNYEHKYFLVEAECARIQNKHGNAQEFYNKALESAKKSGFIHEEALANEFYARYWLNKNENDFGYIYLKRAYICYKSWGAAAKCNSLYDEFGDKALSIKAESKSVYSTLSNSYYTSSGTSSTFSNRLDLISVMKAAQAISGEMNLSELLSKIMKIVLENAGAQKGFLLLENNGEWMIEVQGNLEGTEVKNISRVLDYFSDDEILPFSIINYVTRTNENVVLNNAVESVRFKNDPFIKKFQPKSVLCMPIRSKNVTSAVLYLENNLVTGSFTSNRLQVLQLLSSQAAVSIDNAKLYTNFSSVYENALEGIFQVTVKGVFTHANPSFLQIMEYDSFKDLQKHIPKVPHNCFNNIDDFVYFMKKLIKSDIAKGFETRLIKKSGEIFWVLLSGYSVKNIHGEIISYDGTIIDITEKKKAENELFELNTKLEQRVKDRTKELQKTLETLKLRQMQLIQAEKMSSLGQLVAGMAHELNNPVNFLLNSVYQIDELIKQLKQLVNEVKPPGEQGDVFVSVFEPVLAEIEELLPIIHTGSTRISRIVTTLKNFSHHDRAIVKSVNIQEGLDSTLEMINEKLSNIKVVKKFEELPLIECKAALINQAFMNISVNAIDALIGSRVKKPVIMIRTKMENDIAVIEFEDNGPGIPSKVAPNIFDPFFTTKEVGSGTGLGLSEAYKVVKDHNGSLTFETGKWGTKFVIKIPAKMVQN